MKCAIYILFISEKIEHFEIHFAFNSMNGSYALNINYSFEKLRFSEEKFQRFI